MVQLIVENGDDEVRKHLDTAPRNANYGSHVFISEYLDAISLCVQKGGGSIPFSSEICTFFLYLS